MPPVRLCREVLGYGCNTGKLNRLPGALLPWYRENRRVLPWREQVSAYRTWVSEIMLQQTRVAAVIPYFSGSWRRTRRWRLWPPATRGS